MKFCTKCKVNVHHQLNNCPLCGCYLDEKDNNDKCGIYKDIDKKVTYPTLHEKTKLGFFEYKFNKILLTILLVAVIINWRLTPQSNWAAYVVIAILYIIFAIMMPINNKYKLTRQIKLQCFALTHVGIALEFAIGNGSFAWISVEYVLPWVYVAGIVLIDFLIIFLRYKNKQLFTTLISITIFALLPQTALWIADAFDAYAPQTNICLLTFIAAIFNLIVVFVLCSRSLKEEMERNWNI